MSDSKHKTVDCKFFPKCLKGDKCTFKHPICKFYPMCCKGDKCTFTHIKKEVWVKLERYSAYNGNQYRTSDITSSDGKVFFMDGIRSSYEELKKGIVASAKCSLSFETAVSLIQDKQHPKPIKISICISC